MDRYQAVLDALEDEGEWVTNRVVPESSILGQIGEIEAGTPTYPHVVPLEVTQVSFTSSGKILTVPTEAETLRIKAFLIVKRNQVRLFWTWQRLLSGMALNSRQECWFQLTTITQTRILMELLWPTN